MLRSLLNSRVKQRRDVSSGQVKIVKTDHGWLMYYLDSNPETRYQPVGEKTLRRLKKQAEADYAERIKERELSRSL